MGKGWRKKQNHTTSCRCVKHPCLAPAHPVLAHPLQGDDFVLPPSHPSTAAGFLMLTASSRSRNWGLWPVKLTSHFTISLAGSSADQVCCWKALSCFYPSLPWAEPASLPSLAVSSSGEDPALTLGVPATWAGNRTGDQWLLQHKTGPVWQHHSQHPAGISTMGWGGTREVSGQGFSSQWLQVGAHGEC